MPYAYEIGDAVVVPDGRVGMLTKLNYHFGYVKFGADGPIKYFPKRALRWATQKEVSACGLDGVGGLNVRRF